nr:JmjC domain-containing protein [Tanacetum cinerariifolium]
MIYDLTYINLNPASFSRSHETDTGPFTNMEDAPMECTFPISPPRSTQDPPAGQPSGGAEDPITLTALSSVVSTLMPKVHYLETELKDHKKLFKDVVGTLGKKVKALEVKLKTRKRKMVVSDYDQEDGEKQDVELDALRALANVAVTVDSNAPSGGTSQIPATSPSVSTAGPPGTSTVPPGPSAVLTGTLTVLAGRPSVPADVPSRVAPAGVSSKGKSPMVEEDIPVKARIFNQMKEDRLGEEAAKRLHDEELAQMVRQRAEVQRRRQQEVFDSAMYYNEADWINIRAQVKANACLSKTLLGDDVSEDNFPARMAALIKRKRQALAEKLAKERHNRLMTQAQQRAYMRQYVKNQSSGVYTTRWSMAYVKYFTDDQLKVEFEKIRKSTKAPILSVPEVSQSPADSSPPSFGTRKKSLSRKRLPKPNSSLQELNLDADAQTFVKVVSNKDSDDEAPPVWFALVGWEVIPTPPGDINALYHIDDVSYPLSVKLIKKMLMHKLEIDSDVMGNDMTTAEQLIQFIKNQLVAAQASSV